MPKKIIALAVLPAAVLALTGCDKNLSTDQMEPNIEKTIEQSGAKVTSVDCPNDVTVGKGNDFECTAKLANGKQAAVPVKQTDDKGHVLFDPRKAIQAGR